MNLPFFIARRYLLSKRKKNFINIISILSMISVAFCTAALVIVLSVFNGLEDLLRSLNHSFDPELKIEASKGKSFERNAGLLKTIQSIEGVEIVTEVIEDYAYARYREANQVVMVKGVSENFLNQHRIDDKIVNGTLRLKNGNVNYAIIGRGVEYSLSVAVGDPQYALQLYYINNLKGGTLDPSTLYSRRTIIPGSAFSIVQAFDENYVIVPLDFAADLMKTGDKRTSLEIKAGSNMDVQKIQRELKSKLGSAFTVLNLEEQHKDLYRLLKMEKLFTFLAFTLLIGISSINIFFSLMMLAIDKKKDISVLSAMGGDQKLIRNIFLTEGALIAIGGSLVGLILGGIFCVLQLKFGIISMGLENSVTEGYPVKMIASDFLYTMAVVSLITFITSYRPAVLAARSPAVQNL